MNTIIRPIAIVLGKFLDIIFNGMDSIGIGNIGIAIIVFTVIVKLAMMPLTFSQQKTVKVTQIMQPEIKAIRAKYSGRRDNEAMQMQNKEIRDVYTKYGASQTGGCIQLIIQLPILFALFQVLRNLPIYLERLNTLLANVLSSINVQGDYLEKMNTNFGVVDWNVHDTALSQLNTFTAEGWSRLGELFPSSADVIAQSSERVLNMNYFLGAHLPATPTEQGGIAILIPIFAGISQFISARLGQNVQGDDRAAKIQAWMMSALMPVISIIFAFRVPSGVGLYWITTAVVQSVMQLLINHHYKNMSAEQIIAQAEQKRLKKEQKKAKKRGTDADTIIDGATMKTKNIGSGGVSSYSNKSSMKDKATLSRPGYTGSDSSDKVKYKGKNLKSPFEPPEPEKPKKRKLFGKSSDKEESKTSRNADNTANKSTKKTGNDTKNNNKNSSNKEVKQDTVKEKKRKQESKKDTAPKSLSEAAGKVQKFNESEKSSSSKRKKK